jgi:hypothetical protein
MKLIRLIQAALKRAHERGLGLMAVAVAYAVASLGWAWLVWGHPYRPTAALPGGVMVMAISVEVLLCFGAVLFWLERSLYLQRLRARK